MGNLTGIDMVQYRWQALKMTTGSSDQGQSNEQPDVDQRQSNEQPDVSTEPEEATTVAVAEGVTASIGEMATDVVSQDNEELLVTDVPGASVDDNEGVTQIGGADRAVLEEDGEVIVPDIASRRSALVSRTYRPQTRELKPPRPTALRPRIPAKPSVDDDLPTESFPASSQAPPKPLSLKRAPAGGVPDAGGEHNTDFRPVALPRPTPPSLGQGFTLPLNHELEVQALESLLEEYDNGIADGRTHEWNKALVAFGEQHKTLIESFNTNDRGLLTSCARLYRNYSSLSAVARNSLAAFSKGIFKKFWICFCLGELLDKIGSDFNMVKFFLDFAKTQDVGRASFKWQLDDLIVSLVQSVDTQGSVIVEDNFIRTIIIYVKRQGVPTGIDRMTTNLAEEFVQTVCERFYFLKEKAELDAMKVKDDSDIKRLKQLVKDVERKDRYMRQIQMGSMRPSDFEIREFCLSVLRTYESNSILSRLTRRFLSTERLWEDVKVVLNREIEITSEGIISAWVTDAETQMSRRLMLEQFRSFEYDGIQTRPRDD